MKYHFSYIASYPNGTIGRAHLTYEFCPCRNQYSFKSGKNELLSYLRNCKGWSEDPEGVYTINYIFTVLFANWKWKNLIRNKYELELLIGEEELEVFGCEELRQWFVTDLEAQSESFGYSRLFWDPCTVVSYLGVYHLRGFIASTYLNTHGVYESYSVPFLCYNDKKLLRKILNVSVIPEQLYYDGGCRSRNDIRIRRLR